MDVSLTTLLSSNGVKQASADMHMLLSVSCSSGTQRGELVVSLSELAVNPAAAASDLWTGAVLCSTLLCKLSVAPAAAA